jgi:hypothetical protein
MREKILDELMKTVFKKACTHIDISRDVMKKIEQYENKRFFIKNIFRFILICFTVVMSVLSLVLIELFFAYHTLYLRIYTINTNIIKYSLEGFYVLVIVTIVTIIFRFQKLKLFRP